MVVSPISLLKLLEVPLFENLQQVLGSCRIVVSCERCPGGNGVVSRLWSLAVVAIVAAVVEVVSPMRVRTVRNEVRLGRGDAIATRHKEMGGGCIPGCLRLELYGSLLGMLPSRVGGNQTAQENNKDCFNERANQSIGPQHCGSR